MDDLNKKHNCNQGYQDTTSLHIDEARKASALFRTTPNAPTSELTINFRLF